MDNPASGPAEIKRHARWIISGLTAIGDQSPGRELVDVVHEDLDPGQDEDFAAAAVLVAHHLVWVLNMYAGMDRQTVLTGLGRWAAELPDE